MNRRRIVITGRGVVSALGNTPEELYSGLAAGKCAIRPMGEWGGSKLAAPVDLPPETAKKIPRQYRRSMGNIGIYAVLAARAAADDAGLTPEELSSGRCGCVIGSTMGSSSCIAETFRMIFAGQAEEIPATQFFKCVSHTAAFNTAAYLNICGNVQSPSAACASAVQAVGQARDLIAWGVQDIVICGGADELSPEVNDSFDMINASLNASGSAENIGSRPFDAERIGLVCGEGSGILVLEELEHAKKRGAHIYGEILGYATCGCPANVSQSDASAIMRCLELVCRDAGIPRKAIDYVSAHATSTVQGDREEAAALREFFGSDVPVSSLKGNLGHTLGASGTIEMIAVLEMMKHGTILPTLHLEHIAEDCAGLHHVQELEKREIRTFLKNSFAFGGINATLLCADFSG